MMRAPIEHFELLQGIDVVGVDHVSDFHVTRYAAVKVPGASGALAAGCWGMEKTA